RRRGHRRRGHDGEGTRHPVAGRACTSRGADGARPGALRHDDVMSYDFDRPDETAVGFTYAGVAVRLGDPVDEVSPHEAVLGVLTQARFSGWLGPAEPPWTLAVADNPAGSVAGDRADIGRLAARLAAELGTVTLGISVLEDRVLRLVLCVGADVLGEYVSDPSALDPTDDELASDPVGAEIAGPLVRACGQGDADEVGELLAEELERGSVFESERLTAVLRQLGVPTWLVAADSLPRAVPGGPAATEVTRLGAGTPGPLGLARGLVVGAVRKRRPPRD
ncbi:MAG TPA: hypothetical protein PLS68_10455, partial [Actinotalea sp.]|nr:hypothetical protein [Actinotalea sp.]